MVCGCLAWYGCHVLMDEGWLPFLEMAFGVVPSFWIGQCWSYSGCSLGYMQHTCCGFGGIRGHSMVLGRLCVSWWFIMSGLKP